MTLSVEPQALVSFARQLDRAAVDVWAMRSYLNRHAAVATGGEQIEVAKAAHEQAVEVINGTLNRLACLLENSAPELRAAAGYYRTTDRANADRLDRTLPSAGDRCITRLELELANNPCAPANFVDVRDVRGHLDTPGSPDKPANSLGWMDCISPASWLNEVFNQVFGFDPIGRLQSQVSGDWEALAKMAPVVDNIGGALHDLAYNVQAGTTTLQPMWQGVAGDGAFRYFTTTANATADLHTPLSAISTGYREMADAVWSAGEALGGVVKSLIDAAIITGLAAAAGTATSATGVGALVGYGVAAAEVANMFRLWAEATKLCQQIAAAVLAFRAVLTRELSGLDTVALPALPDGGRYDHPLADPAA
ncbi:WXG100 family type VII secretion target [Micromonospora noduli]|uniref:WXG100 family type VII secretion target n=1 Tax=Micromonospora noduli TaxID=709876 RepID=UPI001788C99A|nr:type VII secretion target [Micromonospora noduli]